MPSPTTLLSTAAANSATGGPTPMQQTNEVIGSFIDGWPGWAQILVIVAVIVCGVWLLQRLVWAILRRAAGHDQHSAKRKLVKHTSKPAGLLAIGVGLSVACAVIEQRDLMPAWINGWWAQALTVVNILAGTWLVIGVIAGLDDLILSKYRIDVKDNLRARRVHTQVLVISRTLMIIVGVVGVALALLTFDSVGRIGASLLASAGIAGIAVGFAAKPVLGNIIAGIQIALTQPIRIDDAVIIGGEWGWIEEITTTYVVVKIWDERRLIVPFSKIIEEPFENWTRKSADILGSVVLYVDYSCPVDAVRDELDRILDGHPKWDGRAKVLQVIDCTEKSMVLRVLVTAADSPTAWELRCDVRERLLAFLMREYPWSLPRRREQRLSDEDVTRARRGVESGRTHICDDPTLADAPSPPPTAAPVDRTPADEDPGA
ncbi:MAG: mechanosensitive ion channel family protein [Phycisphaeraceae bacterium]|nr:MAG: mechanosensitive ion channel family protein [Phycisphaeraceae bacterium]